MTDLLLTDEPKPAPPAFKLLRSASPQVYRYPRFRYMGSKHRLIPWLHALFQQIDFDTVTDAFSGSGVVSYLLKSMGKEVHSNDSLHFPSVISKALIENNSVTITKDDLQLIFSYRASNPQDKFIQTTYGDIFYTPDDLVFLDDIWVGIREMCSPLKQSVILAALLRSCIKRQPRGVFTVSGNAVGYQDGRRDLKLNLKEHLIEQVECYNAAVFSNGRRNKSHHGDIFSLPNFTPDLVYMDPPYVPRSDDNCYMKRYHFLEGLSCYWQGMEIMESSKVKKIRKPYSPFGHRKDAMGAFDRLFRRFKNSIQVLSYSSNAYPDLDCLVEMMSTYKTKVDVLKKPHRYHFGTHRSAKRNVVEEYLIVGQS